MKTLAYVSMCRQICRQIFKSAFPAGNYMFKVNSRNKSRSGIFIVNFEHISHLVLVFLLLTLST